MVWLVMMSRGEVFLLSYNYYLVQYDSLNDVVMFLQGVMVVELDSHPDHNNYLNSCTLRKYPSQILTTLHSIQPTP